MSRRPTRPALRSSMVFRPPARRRRAPELIAAAAVSLLLLLASIAEVRAQFPPATPEEREAGARVQEIQG